MFHTFPAPHEGAADGGVRVELPQTLHGQLFLLAYDRCRFGLALRTAMLTDLYLTGHLADEADRRR
jgi:hypothetical protein